MNLFDKLISTGIDKHTPEWQVDMLKEANKMPFTALFSSLIFTYIVWQNYPAFTFAPATVFITCFLHYIFAYQKWHNLTRIVASVTSTTAITIIHLGIVHAGESLLISLFVLQIAISLTPWVLFDQREEKPLWSSSIYNIALLFLIIGVGGQNRWGYDDAIFRSGSMYYICLSIALLFFFTCLLAMQLRNKKVALKQDHIIHDMQDKQVELEANSQQLNQYIDEVQKAREEDERRQWIASGTSEIDKILRSDKEMNELQDALIKTVVQYTKSNQGGLFILQDEHDSDLHLQLTACYAFDRKKFLNKRIEIGQGLVGQCYLESELTMLTEIPENYVTITSGLGDANPRCLIIVPLIYNEKVQGVLELASFHTYKTHEIQYLREAAGSLASYIVTMKTGQRTNKLLEEFQDQTESMRAQEEEMRQNFEELMATQEQMNRYKTEQEEKVGQLQEENRQLKERLAEVESSSPVT